jgi:glucosamine--fructose-6-phosphate aminotransferase (isomerizing)
MTTRTDQLADLDGLLTWQEASTAGSAIAAAVAAGAKGAGTVAANILASAERVLVTGAGSSFYLATTAAAVARSTVHRPYSAVPLSEVLLRPGGVFVARSGEAEPVIVISRSGSTSEAVAVVEAARASGHPTIGVTCRADSPVAQLADVTLVSPAGNEHAVVMTRSFGSMLALLLRVIASVAGDESLAEDLGRTADCWPEAVAAAARGRELGRSHWSRVVALGGGPRYGIAAEWGLKLLETSQVPTMAYEPLEFRHGPISVCEPGVLVVGFVGGDGAADEVRVLHESRRLGASTWLLAGDPSETGDATAGDTDIVGRGLEADARLPLLLTPGHALALSLALTRGRDPDAPRHLDQVVILEPG